MKTNFEVIDQFFSAQMSANESEATLKALRPQVEEAVKELIRQQGKPANFTGTLEYHGFKIVVRRPTSYTWEQNTQIQDSNLDFYKQLHGYYEQLQENVKEARAEARQSSSRFRVHQTRLLHRHHGVRCFLSLGSAPSIPVPLKFPPPLIPCIFFV